LPKSKTTAVAPVRKRLAAADRRKVIEDSATGVFSERGYHGASIDEIARRSGVSVPVVYDHFVSKRDLYQHLIERHYTELRGIWFQHAAPDAALGEWLAGAIGAWFAYIEHHPFAGRMLFRDTTGDPDIAAAHRQIQDRSRAELLPLVVALAAPQVDLGGPHAVELAWETMRAVLQGLALWWYEHPEVPRETIVTSALNAIWIGLERFLAGDAWTP
jgi:AcrR family transcriptional regulator